MFNLCKKLSILICIFFNIKLIHSQEQLVLGGGFQTNANLFIRDSLREAYKSPQYSHQLFGSESWLDLTASYLGFTGAIRFDAFNNSNLRNPVASHTDFGIGKWYIQKETDQFEVAAGYLYDQIGSGIIYRAYEERAQLIDNALIGVSGKYKWNDNWSVRGFVGKQKNLFDSYNAVLKGVAVSGFYKPTDSSSWSIAPGFGFVNRTFGEAIVNQLTGILSTSYHPVDQFNPYYNSNAVSVFNNLNWKDFSWYFETAYKPTDIFEDDKAIKRDPIDSITTTTIGKLVSKKGTVYYTSLSYAKHKLGITAEFKRTDGFLFRTEPLLSKNNGLIGYIPPMAKINTFRLTSFYYPATQFLDEMAYQFDIKYGLGEHWNLSLNYSEIRDKNFDKKYYKEIYAEAIYKHDQKWQLTGGIQHQFFNLDLYYQKVGEAAVKTITPFVEYLYRFTRKTSLRIESQYMNNDHDTGSWIFGLAELGFAPHFLFELSDMYNAKPTKGHDDLHYISGGMVYTKGSNRFGLRYVQQREGIICSGGICRLEPAFSGMRLSITSTF